LPSDFHSRFNSDKMSQTSRGNFMISLRTHNIFDYVVGTFLVLCPFIVGFSQIAPAVNVFMISGIVLVVYSLLTNYYYSLTRVIPLGVHMMLDALLGIFLILSPALFGYRNLLTDGQYAFHVVVGIGVVGFVAITQTRSETMKSPFERMGIAREAPLTR
jgi:hypothetical protein